ncbi:aspartate aminotransferase family protein [Parasphingopyxis marina]|uniref:Aspartate aminotransferase family protein n=1 Tax=Parasphingopyxis marina TaxID=2761622 RepID=A0A842I3G8_9SPHN|nr:aspartate aminotransferase family protein [Parasphingopyxis marina]MBC2778950.1 aspartate aminotransferase family protein [Parasphingopyxis marina]
MVNAYDGNAADILEPRERAMVEERARLLGPAYRLFYKRPVHFVRGEGVWLFDTDGNRYLDAYNNVASVGHCHPHVVDAICTQSQTLNTHTRYLGQPILDYAARILKTFPPELSHVMFTCTGSEANDLALRIARAFTGKQGVIVTENAYHGVTESIAAASPSLGPDIAGRKRIKTVPLPGEGQKAGAQFADDVRKAAAGFEEEGVGLAALLVDPIFSSDGLRPDPAGFLRPAIDEVHEAGGVFIADEVQSGFGRTGSHFWGFERHGIVPDLVTMGKPMGNGHPVAAVVAAPAVVAPFGKSVRYFNTFGGNAVSCAAANAVLDVIEREQLTANAVAVGAYLAQRLHRALTGHPAIGAIRTVGLFAAIDIVEAETGKKPAPQGADRIVNAMCDKRILISATGREGHTLKIRPPLIFETGHVDILVEALCDIIGTPTHDIRAGENPTDEV